MKTVTKQKVVAKQSGGIINFLIKILKSLANIINKFTPFIWILNIINKIRSSILSFFTSFRVIRESFLYLNKLQVFQLMRKIIRILSILSLLFNLLIFGIFSQFSPLVFISSIPGLSQITGFVYESSSEKTQGYINWIALKIKTLILWIWFGIIDFIKDIIKSVLGSIESDPDLKIPNKREIHNEISHDKLAPIKDHFNDYKYYYLIGSSLFLISVLGYIYWDSISSCWRRIRRDDDTNDEDHFYPLPLDEDIHGPSNNNIPSPDSSSSGSTGSLKYFRSSILDKVNKYSNKVKNFITSKAKKPEIENFPTNVGIYHQNGKEYWNGLPLPRVETLDDGREIYIVKAKDGLINAFSNNIENFNKAYVINPNTGLAINNIDLTTMERITYLNQARSSAIYIAPSNSITRNPMFSQSNFDDFSEIPLGPQPLNTDEIPLFPKPLNLDKGKGIASGSYSPSYGSNLEGNRTPTHLDYSTDVTNPFSDN